MKLRELRLKENLNQKDVADALGISTQVYSRYEREDHKADYAMLCKMADFFNVSLDELFGRTSEPALFDDARLPKSEIQQLFDELTPAQQENLLNYARGMAVANALDVSVENKKHA